MHVTNEWDEIMTGFTDDWGQASCMQLPPINNYNAVKKLLKHMLKYSIFVLNTLSNRANEQDC